MVKNWARQKVLRRIVGGRLGKRRAGAAPAPGQASGLTLTFNQKLMVLAAWYQGLGVTPLPAMNDAASIHADDLKARWYAYTIFAPMVDALSTIGLVPQDATVGAVLKCVPLSPREARRIATFYGETHVAAKRVAGRIRSLKRSA